MTAPPRATADAPTGRCVRDIARDGLLRVRAGGTPVHGEEEFDRSTTI